MVDLSITLNVRYYRISVFNFQWLHWQITSLCPPTDVSINIDITDSHDVYSNYNTTVLVSNEYLMILIPYYPIADIQLLLYSVMMLEYLTLSITISVSNVTIIIINTESK